MKITNRDLDTAYHKVQQSFKEIDMSSNRFVERPRIIKPFSKEAFVGDSITVSTTYFLPQMVQCFYLIIYRHFILSIYKNFAQLLSANFVMVSKIKYLKKKKHFIIAKTTLHVQMF